jgi:hypothetical protein
MLLRLVMVAAMVVIHSPGHLPPQGKHFQHTRPFGGVALSYASDHFKLLISHISAVTLKLWRPPISLSSIPPQGGYLSRTGINVLNLIILYLSDTYLVFDFVAAALPQKPLAHN